jgi:NhaP-type Na+/H+ or K+/H+ antiporter/mannitol/fructose-specific phosphotransferase system IIA component (Ntr-type)
MEPGHTHEIVLTLTVAIFAGAALTILARRIAMPTISLLLLGGFVLGPEVLGIVQPSSLQEMLPVIVSLSIGIILFEGGMTLDIKDFLGASRIIQQMLTIGVLVTWMTTAAAVRLIFGFPPMLCLLAGSLVIVTGPTVIQPLLKRIRIQKNLHSILQWEGVLIDPVGVFIAVLSFDLVAGGSGSAAITQFLVRFISGILVGYIGGELISFALKRRFVSEDAVNLLAVAGAMMVFGIAEAIISEGGLLAVTIAGLVLGHRKPAELKAIVHFKSTITDLLIGLLFILLIARLEVQQFIDFGWRGVALVAAVMFVVRPIAVGVSSIGTGLKLNEFLLLSWVAPRGVVAASMASLFGLALARKETFESPLFLESFVYSTIVGTILLQGFTAAPLAVLLKLRRNEPRGWLIVGAHEFARRVALFIETRAKVPVVLIDSNRSSVSEAREKELVAFAGDARDLSLWESRGEFADVGNMLALTDNDELNQILSHRWAAALGRDHVFHWSSGLSERHSREDFLSTAVVWKGTPRPSFICDELATGEAALEVTDALEKRLRIGTVPLLALRDGNIMLDPAPGSSAKAFLVLRRRGDPLLNALHQELIIWLDTRTRSAIFAAMIQAASRLQPNIKVLELTRNLLEHERQYPSIASHGVSVPHIRVKDLSTPICVVARTAEAVTFTENEASPVRLVFLLLTPERAPEAHLTLLSEIVRLASNDVVRNRLLTAETPGDFLEIIRRHRFETLFNKKP